jgi:uncharacterized protein YcfJ
MKHATLAITLVAVQLSACSTVPHTPPGSGYVEQAEVVAVQPIYQTVQAVRPVQECWMEPAPAPRRLRAAPLVGGIIGGVAGSHLGRGASRLPLAVAGALLGAAVGNDVAAPAGHYPGTVGVQRCRTTRRYEPSQKLVGYRVDYRYEGQTFSTRTARHPGRFIPLRVEVDPADGG